MRALLFSNIWVAAAAAALTLQTTYCVEGTDEPRAGLLGLVFFATLLVYNLDRLVSASREDAVDLTERHRWIRTHRKKLWGVTALAGLGAVASLALVSASVWLGLVPLAAISLAYSLPVFGKADRRRRLKDLPGVKIFLVALVWGLVTVVLPVLEAHAIDHIDQWGPVFAERLVFIFAITIPFDVRDVERDRRAHIVTLPMRLGASGARWLAVALIGLFCALVIASYGLTANGPTLPLLASGLISAVALAFGHRRRGELYYVGLLDGLMLLQAGMVVAYVEWMIS